MDCLSTCGRILIVVLNIIFLLVGMVIFGLGMVLKFGFEKVQPYLDDALKTVKDGLKELSKSSGPLGQVGLVSNADVSKVDEIAHIIEDILKDIAIALIVIGSVMLVIVLLGMCGACYKIRIFLYVYSVIIFIMFVAMVTLAGLYLNKRDIIDDKVKPNLKKSLEESYAGLKGFDFVSLAWNFVMTEFSCCGVDTSKDFTNALKWTTLISPGVTLKTPLVCCKTLPKGTNRNDLDCAVNPTPNISNFETGCYGVLWSYVEKYNKYVMTTVILVSLIEAVIIFLSCWIACKAGKGKVGHMDD